LTGPIEQVPSSVSAIKVDGQRSYARVRAGEDVELAARPVTIHAFDVLATRRGEADGTPVLDLDVEVSCSSGTYVRALARDLGNAVRSAGLLTVPRRIWVGHAACAGAQTVEAMEDGVNPPTMNVVARRVITVRELTDAERIEIRYGSAVDPA